MEEKAQKNKWRTVVTWVTFIAFLLLIFFTRHQIANTLKDLRDVDFWVIILIIPLEILNYDAQTRIYRDILLSLGHRFKYWFLYRYTLELNFVSTIFPSGGLSGFSYTTLRFKPKGVSTGQSTLAQLIKFITIFFAFQILLIFALFCLAIVGKVNEVILVLTAALVTLLIVFTLGVVFIIGSETRINGFFTYITRGLNRVINLFKASTGDVISVDRVRRVFTDLHKNYQDFRSQPKQFLAPLFWSFIANLTEVAVLYVVYVAFGHWPNPGAIILAYAVANFAGAISVLPGGIGVYETLMTVVLAAAGIPPSLSIPVTVMYRILNTLIQVIPGYILYQRAVHKESF